MKSLKWQLAKYSLIAFAVVSVAISFGISLGSNTAKTYATIYICAVCVISSVSAIYLALTAKGKKMEQHTFYSPVEAYNNYKEIPNDLDPKFVSEFVQCKHKKPLFNLYVYTALLYSLIDKGYFRISNEDDIKTGGIITITDNINQLDKKLSTSETTYYNYIKRKSKNNQLTMKRVNKLNKRDFFSLNPIIVGMELDAKRLGVKKEYFQELLYTKPRISMKVKANILRAFGFISLAPGVMLATVSGNKLAGIFLALLSLCLLICGTYVKYQGRSLILLTALGESEYAKWRGLYNFLNSITSKDDITFADTDLCMKYLIYATAFGLPKRKIKIIKDKLNLC